jgi:hypothetical protein
MKKCYICLNFITNNLYLSCNTCKDGNVCNSCSHNLIGNYYENNNLLKCGICRQPFVIDKLPILRNVKNIYMIKLYYILTCSFYIIYEFLRFNFINIYYTNSYCNNSDIKENTYSLFNSFVLSLEVFEKVIYWNIIIKHKLLIRTSLSKISCLYITYENMSYITYAILFNNFIYNCSYNDSAVNYFYSILWVKLVYTYIFIIIYCR